MNLLNKAFVGMDIVDGVGKTKQAYNSSSNNKYDNIMGTKPIKTTNMGGQANALNGRNTAMKRSVLASEELDNMCKIAGVDDFLKGMGKSKKTFDKSKANINNNKNNIGKNIKNNIGTAMNNAKDSYDRLSASTQKNISDGLTQIKRSGSTFKKVMSDVANNKSDLKGVSSVKSAYNKSQLAMAKNQFKSGAKSLGKGALKSVPALAGIAGAGYGAYKLMDKFEQKKDPKERNDIYPKAVGAVVGGAMLANAIAKKNPYATLNVVGKSLKNTATKIPKNAIKRTGPIGEFAVGVGEKVKKGMEKTVKDVNKGSRKSTKSFIKTGNGFNSKKNFRKKQASETLDFFFEKQARQVNLGSFAKDVVKDNILRAGIESIPYYAAPAAFSYAVGRDFRKGGKKINKNENVNTTVVNVPIEKSAATVNIGSKTENFIRKGAEGIGRTIIPGIASMAIGRNIMDGMKKIDNGNDVSNIVSQDIPEGHARVIIQSNEKASDKINEMFKNASSNDRVERVSDVLNKLNDDIQKERGNTTAKNTVNLAQGIRKKQKMNI